MKNFTIFTISLTVIFTFGVGAFGLNDGFLLGLHQPPPSSKGLTTMNEIWKAIPDYEGLYEVSNLGRIKSLGRTITKKDGKIYCLKSKLMKLSKSSNQYLTVVFCKNSSTKTFQVHRLVAQAFIPNTNNLPEVNHKNEIKTNNQVDNLEWCEHLYNIRYGTGIERNVISHKLKKLERNAE